MKTQFTFLLIILCVNVSIFMVMGATKTDGSPLVAGVEYTHPLNATGVGGYDFNATDVYDTWSDSTPDTGFALGDLFGGIGQFFEQFRFLIDGVPALLDWFSSFLPVQASVFSLLAWAIRVVTGAMFVTLIIEFISGRELLP